MVRVIKLNNNSKDSYYLHILNPTAIIWVRATLTVVKQTQRLKSFKVATESLIAEQRTICLCYSSLFPRKIMALGFTVTGARV